MVAWLRRQWAMEELRPEWRPTFRWAWAGMLTCLVLTLIRSWMLLTGKISL